MSTLPIINFLGSVYSKKNICSSEFSDNSEFSIVYTVYCIQYIVYEHMFVCTQPHTIVTCRPLSNCRSCEKATFNGLHGSCIARRKRAAIVFEAARSCVEAASSFFGAEKSCVSSMRSQNLTKKIKFFQEKAVTFKKF